MFNNIKPSLEEIDSLKKELNLSAEEVMILQILAITEINKLSYKQMVEDFKSNKNRLNRNI